MSINKVEIQDNNGNIYYPHTDASVVKYGESTAEEKLTEISNKADQAFQSASNGKAAIKAAITGVDPDVTVPSNATFAQLAVAIGQIQTGVDTEDATVIAEQILAGMTAYVKGVKVTGTMPNRGTVNITPGTANQTIPKGYHNGNGVVPGDPDLVTGNIKAGVNIFGVTGKSSVVDTADATIPDSYYLYQGVTAYKNGNKVTGTMPVQSPDYSDQSPAIAVQAGAYSGDGQNYAYMGINNNRYYGGISNIRAYQPDLLASNILLGKMIMGVQGVAIAGKRFQSGMTTLGAYSTFKALNNANITLWAHTVSGLTFLPSLIIIIGSLMVSSEKYERITIYKVIDGDGTSKKSFRLADFTDRTIGASNVSINPEIAPAYVNSSGFCAPVNVDTPCYWFAWE